MKAMKSLSGLANWLMRVGIGFMGIALFFNVFEKFDFEDIFFYLSFLYLLFAAGIIVGGLMKKPATTVISALVLTLLNVFYVIKNLQDGLNLELSYFILLLGVSIYFLSRGNSQR